MATLLLLHGPNLNMLGQRQPDVYGVASLAEIDQNCRDLAKTAGHELLCQQSNSEEALINTIQQAKANGVAMIIINPAAFTHTSVAIRDALLAVALPIIEVHLSNPHAREPFRQHSYVSDIALGIVSGFGALSYTLAVTAAIEALNRKP